MAGCSPDSRSPRSAPCSRNAFGRKGQRLSRQFAVGTLAGPAIGGAFAQAGAWRAAFVAVGVGAVVLALVALRSLPQTKRSRERGGIPIASLVLLTLAVGAASVASIVPPAWMWPTLTLAAALVVVVVIVERSSKNTVLPSFTYRRGNSLKWTYLAIVLGTSTVAVEFFTPLFGQRMIGLSPLVAGFLGATVSAGWSVAGILSARAATEATKRRLAVAGPSVSAVALAATTALQLVQPSGVSVLGWGATLFVAGIGIGMANPHLSVAAMASSADEHLAAQAAAGIPIVSQIAQTFMAAIGGVLVNLAMPSVTTAAAHVSITAGIASVLCVAATLISLRRRREVRDE